MLSTTLLLSFVGYALAAVIPFNGTQLAVLNSTQAVSRTPASRIQTSSIISSSTFRASPAASTQIAVGNSTQPNTQPCAAAELIYAAGTFEVGLGSVGRPLAEGLAVALPGLSTCNIPYSTAPEYEWSVDYGTALMEHRIHSRLASCPNTKFALAGYSKGALVVHHTNLKGAALASIKGIAVFGDPDTAVKGLAWWQFLSNTWPISEVLVNGDIFIACVTGDAVCDGGSVNGIADHLSYSSNGDVPRAVAFLASLLS